jgi:hypothetical protein
LDCYASKVVKSFRMRASAPTSYIYEFVFIVSATRLNIYELSL